MDIPALEELEWLESHKFDDDPGLDIEPPSPPSSPEPQPGSLRSAKRPTLSLPPKPSPLISHYQISASPNKRFRSDIPSSESLPQNTNSSSPENRKRIRCEELESLVEKLGPSENDQGIEGTDIRSDGNRITGVSLDGNVGSVADKGGSDEDEEWLRYSPPLRDEDVREVVREVSEEPILSRYAMEIEGDCFPVTGLDGGRVYAKICAMEVGKEEPIKKLNIRGDQSGLLQESVRILMQRVEQDEFTKALQASVDGAIEVAAPGAPVINEQLWVDKYYPNSFTELLSDEQTNREVLLWLKQWDSCVFGSEIKSTSDDVLSALKRHSSGFQHFKQSYKSYHGSKRGPRFNRDIPRAQDELDKENTSGGLQEIWEKRQKGFGPPEQKILLLSGPPGLGKTTLAHVAARHCGYHVVEINASDDRSSSTVEAKILDVIQMNSVMADSKPKCLVIDEIDGALGDGKGAVDIIVRLVSSERKGDTGKENVDQEEHLGRKSSRKKETSSSLLRPVICICNDLYAPALRPLWQVAKGHIFVQPAVSRVVNRLKFICNKEEVKASSVALTALAEYTECDIRSCLNTLQFLNKKKETLNVLEISSQVVGRKDVSKSAFNIWKEIFQKRKEKQAQKSLNSGVGTSKDFEFLYSLISNRGDYDLILDGVHENILQLRYVDPVMQKTVKCLDNLIISDITHRYIMRTQQMSLQVYQPPIAICIHDQIAQYERKDIEWPKSSQRHRTILSERMDMFQMWHNRILPYMSRHLSTKSFVEDSISHMLHILSPPTIRPVALHLLSENEKSDLSHLVNIMVSYAITYKNIKSDWPGTLKNDGSDSSSLSLDPPLHEFIHYKGYKSCHFDLAFAVKQVLVHEVEKQKILQSSASKSIHLNMDENHTLANNSPGNGKSSKLRNTLGSAEKKIIQKSPTTPELFGTPTSNLSVAELGGHTITNDSQKSAQQKKKPSGVLNFFDRYKKGSSEGSLIQNSVLQNPATVKRDSLPLLFKFNEGFTNAVKRPVRVREFLL